ncbi:MAG: DUF177 domain-containing protein [Bdellovibrio sp.]|nr:DUF177 domain-containing protein [Bdellovibrio sp.]
MKIFLHEIKEQETTLDFTQKDLWAKEVVSKLDEKDSETTTSPKTRTISAHFTFRKINDIFLVVGKVDTEIQLLCSRCVNPYLLRCEPSFSILFCKDPAMAGAMPFEQKHSLTNHFHYQTLPELENTAELELTKDVDINYIATDFIDLAEVLNEQLTLELPFQPLCHKDCEGLCPGCGTDLNENNCECSKDSHEQPFAALKNLKHN